MTMVIFLHTSVERCGGGHGISSKEEGIWSSSSTKERVMAMVIFLHTSLESCGGGHGISSREQGLCPSSPKTEGHILPFLSRELWRWSWMIFCRRGGLLGVGKVCP